MKIVLRIDGKLYEELTLRGDRLPSVITRLKIMGNMNIAEHRLPQDGRTNLKRTAKIKKLAIGRGMRTIEQICMEKAAMGLTTVEEILPLATNDKNRKKTV